MVPASSRRRLPAPSRETWAGRFQLGLAAAWLLLAVLDEHDRVFHVVMALLWASLGTWYVVFGRTVLNDAGLRPAGRLRWLAWQDITSVYLTSRHDRRKLVAVMLRNERKPVWIHDPERTALHRWEAVTGRRAGSYGAEGAPETP